VAAFGGAALSAVLLVLRQKGSGHALMPLTMFRNRVFSASLGIASAMTFGMYAMLFLTPLCLQAGRGDGALQAAIELLPLSAAFVIVSQLSGEIANAYGPRLPMTLGMAMMRTGLSMLALIPLNKQPVADRGCAASDRLWPRPQHGAGQRGCRPQRASGAIGDGLRPRQHRPHGWRNARRGGARRDFCGVRRRERRGPMSRPACRPPSSSAASVKCSARLRHSSSSAATRSIPLPGLRNSEDPVKLWPPGTPGGHCRGRGQ
jgi:hypothetical protein